MLSKVVVATLAIGASAFTPAPLAGSKVSMSRVLDAAPAPLAPEPVAVRAPAVVMSGDGEHETLYEMFDPGWVVINMALWGGALLKFGGVF